MISQGVNKTFMGLEMRKRVAGRKQVDLFSLTRHLYKELGKEILMAADVYECTVIKCCYRIVFSYILFFIVLFMLEQSPHLFLTSPFLEV